MASELVAVLVEAPFILPKVAAVGLGLVHVLRRGWGQDTGVTGHIDAGHATGGVSAKTAAELGGAGV